MQTTPSFRLRAQAGGARRTALQQQLLQGTLGLGLGLSTCRGAGIVTIRFWTRSMQAEVEGVLEGVGRHLTL